MVGCTFISCSALAVHTNLTRAGSETTTDRPKIGTLISKMRPCRLIQFRIALRRKAANPTPCTSLGARTGGGPNRFGGDVPHGLAATAGSIMCSPKLRRSAMSARESSLACAGAISVVQYCSLARVRAQWYLADVGIFLWPVAR